MLDLLIHNAHILQVSSSGEMRLLHNYDIAIQENRIGTIQPAGTIEPPRAREIIEAHGMVAMPGLINSICGRWRAIYKRKTCIGG
jgi:predicted amidohydrolase